MKKKITSIVLCTILILFVIIIPVKDPHTNVIITDGGRKLAQSGQIYNREDSNIVVPDILTPCEIKKYTVMIYMIGSNLESRLGNATKDIEEIESSGFDASKANVIIFTGGSRRWVGNVPSKYNCILDMSKSEDERIIAHTDSNADMGAESTLSEFVNFCDYYYPAEHNALIFWDHGGGPLLGYGADELFESDSLLLPEIQNAMRATSYSSEKKLDFVGFDACLMSCIESMNIWEEFANYYVASEELEPGDGWDYSFLGCLNTTEDPINITSYIVDTFSEYYNQKKNASYNPDITLSCIDLAKISSVNRAIDNLATELRTNYSNDKYTNLTKSRAATKCVGLSDGMKDDNLLTSFDLVDIADMASELDWVDTIASSELDDRLSETVIKHYSNVNRLSGISMYYPYINKSQYRQMEKAYDNIAVASNYKFYLHESAQKWISDKKSNWNLGQIIQDNSGRYIQLSDEQQTNTIAAYYSVMLKNDMFGFLPVAEQFHLDLDEQGRIYLPESIGVIMINNDLEGTICPVRQIESTENRNVYSTIGLRADNSPLMISGISGIDTQLTNVIITEDTTDGDLTIQSVNANDTSISLAGKNSIDISDWSGIHISYKGKLPERNIDGITLPTYEWPDSGMYGWDEGNSCENLSFYKCSTENLPEEFVVQIQIEDSIGDVYASDYLCLTSGTDHQKESHKTKSGELSYIVYDDHVVCTKYSGNDQHISLPASINGKAVTSIASRAFYKCDSIQSIVIPSGIKSIGSGAFQDCKNLVSISLPDTLSFIDIGPFAGCINLKTIELNKNNMSFHLINNALFSSDEKKLIYYPSKASGTYTIPNKTEEISYAAFCDSQLDHVILPSSLKVISDYAFYNSKLNAVPDFPDSLEKIGVHAFGCGIINQNEIPDTQVLVKIGKNIRYIGRGAFNMFSAKRFDVDANNPYYSSIDGSLMNKAGDSLVQFATQKRNVAIIPDGVLEFSAETLDYFDFYNVFTSDTNVELLIPPSVTRFPEKGSITRIDKLRIHCAEDSAAESYAKETGIPYDYSTSDELFPEEYVISTDEGKLLFNIYSSYASLVSYQLFPQKGVNKDEYMDEYDSESSISITIPSAVKDLPVKTIGDGLHPIFNNDDFIRFCDYDLIIPEGVETISDNALSSGPINDIKLPSTLKKIGKNAIYISNYYNKEPITLPSGIEVLGENFLNGYIASEFVVNASLKDIAPGAFQYCKGLKSFKSSSGDVGKYTSKDGFLYSQDGTILIAAPQFDNEIIIIPNDTTEIAEAAFIGNQTIKNVFLPKSLKAIGSKAFLGCSALESITIPNQVTTLGDAVFSQCRSLVSAKLPDGISTIPERAFNYCEKLEQITLPNNVTMINSDAFNGCKALLTPKMPDCLESIAAGAFSYTYSNQDSVFYIGKDVEHIDPLAFINHGFSSFEVASDNNHYDVINKMLTDSGHNRILACPCNISGIVTIPDGIVNIGFAFESANMISDLYLPESVVWISQLPEHITLHVTKGSYAERYAQEHNISYVSEQY